MRKIFTTMLVAAFFMSTAFTLHQDIKFNIADLHITWQVVDNNYMNRHRALTALIITNSGHEVLPAGGWKFYFNSGRGFSEQAVSNNAKIKQVNGDLYSITPTDGFKELKPGASTRIEYINDDPVVNATDAPEGIYLVWDAQPEKGYSITSFNVEPYKPTYQGLITPEIVFDRNKNITDIPADQLTKVFPTPASYQEAGAGQYLVLNNPAPVAGFSDKKFEKESRLLTDYIISLDNHKSKNETKPGSLKSIVIKYKEGINAEGYELSITPTGIHIFASTNTGAFYAVQSLKTMIPPVALADPKKSIEIPCAEIKDEPRFTYRAVMLDVARNFQPKKQVLKLLEAMSLYKLNTLHLHLTDDEGWRLELPSLPELTSVGAKRGHTLDSKHFLPASHGSGPDVNNTVGTGFYSRADYIEILRYATDRHIAVVPEIETPGHARAPIKAMDARYDRLMAEGKKAEAEKYLLRDLNDKSEYRSVQYWNDNVIDVSLPSTYNFVSTVVDDIAALYKEAGAPLQTIHFGGDEVPAHVWEKSPAYLALKASHPEIKGTNDLWYYFYGRVNDILKAKGLLLSGWEEMALRKTMLDGHPTYMPNPDFTKEHLQADVWNNVLGDGQEDLAYRLANAGYKVVLTCVTNLYFDMASYKSFDEPGYYWGAFLGIDKFYSFIPFDYFKNADVDKNGNPINRSLFIGKQRLTDYGKGNIVGLQGALWAETVKSTERMDYMIFPRLLALAERAWAADPQWATETDPVKAKQEYETAWSGFLNVLGKRELPRLSYYEGGYNYRIPKPGISLQDGKYLSNVDYPGLTIRYTTNGKEPDEKSKVYTGPVNYNGGVIKFRAFDVKGRGGNVAEGGSNSLNP
ncbi:hexosaminidase [Mucilaginibacter lappiensis]|uniref:beta-N-acetylhexosaminidase n=1 Tax=Mucilaginibacter lappiensis TaxID=354630 RepID=A0ABR6PSS5_9SPHI|nr:family 20 glycosylhydrolase [Mucilaginibacter lappiensis]MBB6112841.1 hexosaminidase [Mucilaginibacter lappiensis]SIS08269.1 hexosaminidase [Mucilaginibacter lappiensis]